ncbi:ras GTPase-activating protein raskol isoform X4 [Hermetia illucens]|uniref:ras GTPase-activating protein raskol isoform X4 n=1 Tax=Hermetia illucens TaxID=343691 RepID=UPI0018CC1BCF|nr:ras GTPase-activating protein raskol isoform X4 [Hermetia illucens]
MNCVSMVKSDEPGSPKYEQQSQYQPQQPMEQQQLHPENVQMEVSIQDPQMQGTIGSRGTTTHLYCRSLEKERDRRVSRGLASCLRGERDEFSGSDYHHSHREQAEGESKSKTLPRIHFDPATESAQQYEDTSYEKACRRGSAPATPILGQKQPPQETQTTSRFTNFFSKRSNPLKRTKSVTKLERSKRGAGGLRGSRSHESLLSSHAVMSTIDLSCTGAVGVAPVHQSVLGRQHCFQVRGGPRGERYYSCGSRQERDLWIYSLRKSIAPNAEHTRRTDNSLKMWIYEAKNLPAKKKYFCEINLDKTLYGRTSVKLQTDLLFWGEYFDFPDIPEINVITVNVFREIEKKKKRDKHSLVGSVKIPIHEVTTRLFSEDWYPILSEKHDSISRNSSKEVVPTLRIKCRFQSIDILPLPIYTDFLQYLRENYKKVCEILEPVIGVKAKEDIGQALVLLMHAQGMAGAFLTDVVALDLLRVGDQRLTFRGNSLATKSMEAFLKLTGEQYLQDTLSEPLNEIIQSNCDCEVDPLKATGSLSRQQQSLRNAVHSTWESISKSHKNFPPQLRECFATFRERLQMLDREDMADNLISASIFLRFLCPAILSPSLFNITNELPSARVTRNLTLVAKTLQTLANFTRFQGKENFMEFLNDFLEQEAPRMKDFLHQISARLESNNHDSILEWAGYIDQGKQLSILHQLLSESIQKLSSDRQAELDPLHSILDEITKTKENGVINTIQNQENQNPAYAPQQQAIVNRLSADRGIIRGVLTPTSLEKNIFRYNDPTVSPLLQKNNASNNSQLSIHSASQQQLHGNLQHSHSQSSIASSQNGGGATGIMIPATIHMPPSASSTVERNANGGAYITTNSSTHYFPSNGNLTTASGENMERMSPSVMRASTLPRNNAHISSTPNNNYEESGINLIQIEPATAFVRKSPTPLLKSSANNFANRNRVQSTNSQLSVALSERSPSKNTININLGMSDAHNNQPPLLGNSNVQQSNSTCNMPMKLEDLDDLLKYAEEHANDPPPSKSKSTKEHLTSKGSNISIGECSSGYQSINTPSQSSSSVEHHDYNNGMPPKMSSSFAANRHANSKLQSNNKYNNYVALAAENNNSAVAETLQALAFHNPMYQLKQPHTHHHHHHHNRNVSSFSTCNGNSPNSRKNVVTACPASSSLTPSSSEENLSNDNFATNCNATSFKNLINTSGVAGIGDMGSVGKEHCLSHRTLSGSSSSGTSGRVPRTNPLMQYKREDSHTNDSYLPVAPYMAANRDGLFLNGHARVGVSGGHRMHRRLSLESAVSDSSTDTEADGRAVGDGKRRRPPRSAEQCEIQRLQASLDSLRHKLDQDAAELRDSNDDLFALQKTGSAASLSGDSKMRSIIERLITMEEELRREQLKMSLALSHKQRVIEAQGQQIAALDAANNRLLSALSALRQRYENQQQQNQQQSNGNC